MFPRSLFALTLASLLLGASLWIGTGAGRPAAASNPEPAAATQPDPSMPAADAAPSALPATLADAVGAAAQAAPETKLSPGLLGFSHRSSPAEKTWVIVQSTRRLELGAFGGYAHQFAWPAGEQVAVLEIQADQVLKLARLPGVYAVDWADARAPREEPAMPAPDGGAPTFAPKPPAPAEVAALRAAAHAAPTWAETQARLQATGTAPSTQSGRSTASTGSTASTEAARPSTPDGWWDVRAGHAAMEAWDMGVKGDGVRVAVLDDAVDFAHPDLQGTWAVLPAGHPYAGWPQVFDPDVGYLVIQDKALTGEAVANRSTRTARNGMIDLYQDSAVAMHEISGTMKATACFRPYQWIGPAAFPVTPTLAAETCDFVVPQTSKSGTLRYGHHPDIVLRGLGAKPAVRVQAEAPGVIIVDEHTSGVYDTVYVDINNNHDFTDEKPMTKDSPLGWRDATGDGIADYSGGLLYFIADGELPYPASWVWGLEKDIPEAGRTIGILYILGAHGTLCASNIVSQGRLGVPAGRDLTFRDLPGDHAPPSVNLGLAPEAELVSIGEIYAFGRAMFAPGWHYSVFGHDIDRHDDDIQVTSNSYGWSNEDNDTWDPDSRLIDFYVRKYSPTTTFHFATGNGGTGYGTLAPPSPSTGIDVAASTQFGSTGADSITDTTQITFGDIIPFSNRGPGANGQNGPDVAADGAYAAGAIPINFIGDGTMANGTWGGTSRSTPVASGATALVYQAFKQKNGRWPSWQEARAIMMAGARFAGYDTFVMGAGVLDAGDAVRTALGRHGVYALPSEWTAGSFRGTRYGPSFAHLMAPGGSDTATITLRNPSDAPVEVTLAAKTLRKLGSYNDSVVGDRTKETTPWGLPEYLVPIDKSKIPAGTELMIVRGIFPYDEFDLLGDRVADNFYVPGVIQHTDINGDGKLWDDKNGNGVVNNQVWTPVHLTLAWGDATGDQSRDHSALQGFITRQLPAEGMTAEIAWYGDGCNVDGQPPVPQQEIAEKIALIQRSTCTFTEKILNAQKAGAIGVVMMTDGRPLVTMGGDPTGIEIPGVMIEQAAGLELRSVLETGTPVTAAMLIRPNLRLKGIDGSLPIRPGASEIQPYEFMTMNSENGLKNHWAIPIHHPRERWASGIYLSLQHVIRTESITYTHMSLRVDSYAYQDWGALSLSQSRVTIPAHGEVTVDATLAIPAGAAYGAVQGAIFADYGRGTGDVPVAAPGGYELPGQRVVIPVNTTVGASYDWKGSIGLGGPAGDDRDAPYNNGAMYGTFKWNWRPESGDWRFFFVDALSKPAPGTFWMLRTRWTDSTQKQADIDTRVFGPQVDRHSNPNDPANLPDPANPGAPVEDRSDPDWFGPYTLALLARSTYLALGSNWPFNTSSEGYEDWLSAPAGEGLHEVMLHNVLFSGTQFEMPYDTTVSSLRLTQRMGNSGSVPVTAESGLTLLGAQCTTVELTSEMDIPDFKVRGFGMSALDVTKGLTVTQSTTPGNPATNTNVFKRDVKLTEEAGRFRVSIEGVAGDDLDLFLLYDANRNGQFEYPTESVAASTSPIHIESVEVPGFPKLGDYQVWVEGWGLADRTKATTFDLTIDIVKGNSIVLRNAPSGLVAGRAENVDVCAELATLEGQPGPASGLLIFGPGGAPQMFQIPVTWHRTLPRQIWLPVTAQRDADVVGRPMP